MKKKLIPNISKKRLQKLAKQIKPIDYFWLEDCQYSTLCYIKGHFYVKNTRLHTAFLWSEEAGKEVTDLKPLINIKTFHRWGYYGFFKPSVAEVLAQIPKKYLKQVVAFRIINHPENSNDLNEDKILYGTDLHVATTRLYVHDKNREK